MTRVRRPRDRSRVRDHRPESTTPLRGSCRAPAGEGPAAARAAP